MAALIWINASWHPQTCHGTDGCRRKPCFGRVTSMARSKRISKGVRNDNLRSRCDFLDRIRTRGECDPRFSSDDLQQPADQITLSLTSRMHRQSQFIIQYSRGHGDDIQEISAKTS